MVRGRHRALPALHADAVVRDRLDVTQAAWTRSRWTYLLDRNELDHERFEARPDHVGSVLQSARLGFWSWSRTSAAAVMAPILQGSRVMRSRAFPVRLRRALARSALGTARALWFELPETYAQLLSGALSERAAKVIVSETWHLDAETRGQVDKAPRRSWHHRDGIQGCHRVCPEGGV
jgi:hypothetical protein